MQNDMLFPDYNKSILNLITSILKHYGVKSEYNTLPNLDSYLSHKYKNVVLMIMDGMGENIIRGNVPSGILNQAKISDITCVYPSTTAAGLMTYYSGKPPIETGWIAWSQYFKEFGREVNVLLNADSYTGEPIKSSKTSVYEMLKFKTVYEQITEATQNTVKVYEIMPKYMVQSKQTSDISIGVSDVGSMCDAIEMLCKNPESKCILSYLNNPDSIIHKFGCYSNETRNFMMILEKKVESLCGKLRGTDTLVIMSADHGHRDIKEIYNILDFQDIQECLIMPPSFEPRMLTFFVKDNRKEDFKRIFNSKFKDKFILYTKQEFLEKGLMGYGTQHNKVDDFLGDYIAISIADAYIKIGTYISNEQYQMQSTHCGLTINEMEVPLIVFDLK